MGWSEKLVAKAKLTHAVLEEVASREAETFTLPGPNDDASRELLDDRLLIAAREYVEAHADEKPLPG